MEKEVVGFCPVCNEKLIASKLTCNACQLDLTGEFSLNRFSYLSKWELKFVYLFLQSEGSYKDVQGKLNITYQKAKQLMSGILLKLQLTEMPEGGDDMIHAGSNFPMNAVQDVDHFVVKRIKEKLNNYGGNATIPLISAGKEARIRYDKTGTGLECDKIPVPNQLTWEAFIATYNIATAQDGELYKGYARAGKLGSDKLPLNSLEGYIAYAVHGVNKGGSAYSPGFVIAAVLDWVGILTNKRGSTVTLISEAVCVESYEEILNNAKSFMVGLDASLLVKEKLNLFRHWYYFDEIEGFAPSKFIGYKDMDMKACEAGFNVDTDGRETEKALNKHFRKAEGSSRGELLRKLDEFLALRGKQPNTEAQIHVRLTSK